MARWPLRARSSLLAGLCLSVGLGFCTAFVAWRSIFAASPQLDSKQYRWRVQLRAAFNPFETLGLEVSKDLEDAEVKTAFRKLAKVYHPDVPETGDSVRFQRIQEAMEEIASQSGRSQWVVALSGGGGRRQRRRGTSLEEDFFKESSAADFWTELEGDDFSPYVDPFKVDFEEWLEKKRKRRLMRMRASLRGGKRRRPVDFSGDVRASPETMSKMQEIIGDWIGLPARMITRDMRLEELQFYDKTAWEEVAKVLVLLEDGFDVDLVEVVGASQLKFQLPNEVKTIADFADLIEAKCQ
eukprot:TRINITY_DN29118_c0_g1_i1.p1 TRINITY_DN29118_c0_g1~~TRINITY_DN29118_c0_g1_i1.p1  ORF type:complete len:311 (-),score=47.97 TRINITY_DN29118_c0_g1_i1:496-1386(-)